MFYYFLYQLTPFIEEFTNFPYVTFLSYLAYSGIPLCFLFVVIRITLLGKFYLYKRSAVKVNKSVLPPTQARFFSTKTWATTIMECWYMCQKVVRPVITIVVGSELLAKLSHGSLNSVPF
jgi:hypothetical protein